MKIEQDYYYTFIDLSLRTGTIKGEVGFGDANKRKQVRESLNHSHHKEEKDLDLNIWYDNGQSLILYTDSKTAAVDAYITKLTEIKDRVYKYGTLFRRAINHVESIKATLEDEKEVVKEYTTDRCVFAKGAIIDLSADLSEQIDKLLGKTICEFKKGE